MKFHSAILSIVFLLPVLLEAQTTCYSKGVEQTAKLYSLELNGDHEKLQEKFSYITGKEKEKITFNLPDTAEYVIMVVTEKTASAIKAQLIAGEKSLPTTGSRPEKHIFILTPKKPLSGDCEVEVIITRNSGFDSCTGFYLFRKR